jgi:hypothetical protein
MLLLLLLTAPSMSALHDGAAACASTAQSSKALPLPRGVVSVVDGFGADPTGVNDSTHELQRAFTAARVRNVTLFLPFGCYRCVRRPRPPAVPHGKTMLVSAA